MTLFCIFCAEPVGDDFITDDYGEVACAPCGRSELAAQRTELRLQKLEQIGFRDAAEFARNPKTDANG